MPTRSPRGTTQSFLLATVVEAAILLIAAAILSRSTPAPAVSLPVPITLVAEEAPPEPPAKAEPLPEPPKAKPIPVKPQHHTPPRQRQTPPVAQAPAPVEPAATEAPNAFTQPIPTPPQPAVPVSGKPDPNDEYQVKVRAAVLAAVYYPPAAAAMHYSGRVRVRFHLRDAIPSNAIVVVSSKIGMIDRAALQTVRNAQYPIPPTELSGKDHIYEVWVQFNR